MGRTLIIAAIMFALGNPHTQAGGEDVTVTTSRRVHPVLIRSEAGALLQIVMDVQRAKDLHLQAMHFTLDGTDDVGDLESLSLFATGDKQEFATAIPFGRSKVSGPLPLTPYLPSTIITMPLCFAQSSIRRSEK